MDCRRSRNRDLAILPELETRRLILRRLELDDAPFVLKLLNEPSFIQNIGDRGVRSHRGRAALHARGSRGDV